MKASERAYVENLVEQVDTLVPLLRDVVADTQGTESEPRCDSPNVCECSWARAYRLLRDRGAWSE